jgi:hypothetical protein
MKMKLEDFEELKCGDQILIDDPLKAGPVVYAFIDKSPYGQYYFVSGYGASFMVDCQKTIDNFNIIFLNENHPARDELLAEQVQFMESMMWMFTSEDVHVYN